MRRFLLTILITNITLHGCSNPKRPHVSYDIDHGERYLYVGGSDGSVIKYDLMTHARVGEIRIGGGESVWNTVLSPNCARLAVTIRSTTGCRVYILDNKLQYLDILDRNPMLGLGWLDDRTLIVITGDAFHSRGKHISTAFTGPYLASFNLDSKRLVPYASKSLINLDDWYLVAFHKNAFVKQVFQVEGWRVIKSDERGFVDDPGATKYFGRLRLNKSGVYGLRDDSKRGHFELVKFRKSGDKVLIPPDLFEKLSSGRL